MFTEYQNSIIDKILKNEIFSVSSFNDIECKDDYNIIKWDNAGNHVTSYIPKDKDKTIHKFTSFVSLIHILNEMKYIYLYAGSRRNVIISKEEKYELEDTYKTPPKTISKVSYPSDPEILKIYEDYIDKSINVLQPLIDYKKRNYLSLEEYKYKKEKNSRILWQIVTIIISILSLLSTIGITIYKMKTANEQVIIIKKNEDKIILPTKVHVKRKGNEFEITY